jgi:hypothetical protein
MILLGAGVTFKFSSAFVAPSVKPLRFSTLTQWQCPDKPVAIRCTCWDKRGGFAMVAEGSDLRWSRFSNPDLILTYCHCERSDLSPVASAKGDKSLRSQ